MCETCGCQGNVVAVSTSEPVAPAPSPPQPFVERLSDGLQHGIQVIIGSQRKPPRRFRSFLNGTWLGHPLHPAITDVPLGAWLMAAVFDIIWLISPVASVWAARAALVSVIIGLVGALASAITGFADWSDTYGAERRVGLYHALLNVAATVLYIVSLILRLLNGSNESIAAAILGFVGLLAVLSAAYFGGDMVFVKGTAVNHAAWEHGAEEFEAVLPLASLEENKLRRVMAANVPLILLRQGENIYAMGATCPHAGGPLDEGTLTGDVVQCPWHGARFCVRNGRVLTGPATVNAPHYETRVRDGQVEVKRVTTS
ncbi:MAG TPA: Rieske 2Fe-2S domain-containing protein [Ktedonosporobacter sp.]|nr:Rieske 2Fe-2S domain-containing protein [Ktedonosporobacter sp.]